ncbi:Uncharacterized protein HSRCO_2825 [Halanaeroarchaeum sp. HSR-CO]|uniref:rod-determining factor RdfA n=1 Tax=Halanaeroarchaeum sp. HSR-CO TaxID=2866382 RepID=UPI00217E0C93|nr:rod-determining factor RdfA [Halanaeroarchaeum sp. HSR-CO]UWG49080.1 Uncharacterized protein HSRCO_2825 [Halanaeroarchaeum sp. HSR-CO]
MGDGCKIDALADRFALTAPTSATEDIDEYLLVRWRGDDGRPADGYGTLTEWFNKQLLGHFYENAGRETLGVRLDSEYEALVGEDELLRAEVEDDLASDGIDPARVREAFVSRSTMRRHLNDCLNGNKDSSTGESDWERRSIDLTLDMAEGRIRDALSSLSAKGAFPDPDSVEIDVEVQVRCVDDPYQIPLSEALAGSFECSESRGSNVA